MANTAINYTPPPTVEEFVKWHLPGQLFYDWILGPVGSGKTTGIIFKIAYMASLQAPSPLDGIRRTRVVVIRNTGQQLNDTTIVSWNYWFKHGQAGEWRSTDKKFILKFADVECEVLFRPLDTPDDVSRVLSLEVTFAVLDEFVQIPKEVVEALSARCGRFPPKIDGGATNWGMFGSSNPGEEDSWWHDYLHETLPDNARLFVQPSGFSPEAENLANLPGGQDYYFNQAKGKSPEWVRQFIEVQWGFSLAGRPVFPMFAQHIHVAKYSINPNPYLPLVIGFDPGMNSALIIGQETLSGQLVVLDELVQRDMGAERVIEERLKPLLKTKYPGYQVIIAPDPAATNRTQTDERSVVDVFKKFFDIEYDTDNTLQPRLEAVEHYLTRLTGAGPALLIDPSCKNLIRALGGGYRYAVDRKGKTAPAPEKNDYSHPADAFQYLCKYFQKAAKKTFKRKQQRPLPRQFDNRYTVR